MCRYISFIGASHTRLAVYFMIILLCWSTSDQCGSTYMVSSIIYLVWAMGSQNTCFTWVFCMPSVFNNEALKAEHRCEVRVERIFSLMGTTIRGPEIVASIYAEVERRFNSVDDLAHGWEHMSTASIGRLCTSPRRGLQPLYSSHGGP